MDARAAKIADESGIGRILISISQKKSAPYAWRAPARRFGVQGDGIMEDVRNLP